MILIDSHAHLDFENYRDDLPEVVDNAFSADVKYIINIAIDGKSILRSIELAERFPNIYATVGIHPHEADKYTEDDVSLVEEYIMHPKVVAVGEIGLDFYRDYADHDHQRSLFRKMIGIAKKHHKPLVIHNRAADQETLRILREEEAGRLGGVFHCFAGDAGFAADVLQFGFYISFAGNLTYPKSELPRTAEFVPIEKTLVETDCPFLAPQKRRGKRNEPAYVRSTAEKLAEIKGLTLEDTARITTANVYRLFRAGPEPVTRIVYPIRNSLYINLTNRCSCDCAFCPRLKNPMVKGHNLKLDNEPNFDDVVRDVDDYPASFDELVFCGYGEPTLRFDLVKQLARHFRARFPRIRLDTNGHGNLINQRDITAELPGVIDSVSISLNASDAESYVRINRPEYGPESFEAMLTFIKSCRRCGVEVTATIVGFPGADVEGTQIIAQNLDVKFRIRKYNDLG